VKASYKSSGVSISEGDKFVTDIKPLVRQTFTRNVLSGIGNFGAFYQIDLRKYFNPVFVSSIDGVGTKLKIASALNKFDTIGTDLVNHCVNDIAVCGAVPMYFLDYYASGKLKRKTAADVIKGIVNACKENKCALIGGETAEMPGIYSGDDFDLAGAIVGIVEKRNILDSRNVRSGNVLIGIESNGLHTNGYSLVRKIFKSSDFKKSFPKLRHSLGRELLKTHRSYLNIIQASLKRFRINSISHITGGGIVGNTKRVVPENLRIAIDWNAWEKPEIFKLIQRTGGVSDKDMQRTFNLGIGLVFIISPDDVNSFVRFLKLKKESPYVIGKVI